MSSPLTEEENARCWEYVMKFSLEDIHKKKDSELNQTCSEHIKSKESFMHYVEDKRRSVRSKEEKDKKEKEEKEGRSEPPPILGRNIMYKSY
jgi:DNA polymerase sigma